MKYPNKSGRYMLAIAIIVFGIIQLINMHFMSGLLPVSQKFPAGKLFLYLTGILFLFGGLGMIGPASYKLAYRTPVDKFLCRTQFLRNIFYGHQSFFQKSSARIFGTSQFEI